jgi:hypothetical protein
MFDCTQLIGGTGQGGAGPPHCWRWPVRSPGMPAVSPTRPGAGWGDTQLAELFAHVAANLVANYFNHYAQPGPDLPAAPGLESWPPRG